MTEHILYISANGFPKDQLDNKGAFSLEHAEALQRQGVEITAVDMQADDFKCDLLSDTTIHRVVKLRSILKRLSIKDIMKYIRTYYMLRQKEYNYVIFSFAYVKYIPFVYFFKKPGVKILMIVHGGDVMPCGFLSSLAKKHLLKIVDLVTPVSDFTATLVSCLMGINRPDKRKVITIYNGVNLSKLMPRQKSKAMRSELNIGKDDFIILSIANLIKRKGIDISISATSKLLHEGHQLHHIIIGTGPEESHLKSLVKKTGYENHFHFISQVHTDSLADYYDMADLFVLVSNTIWKEKQTEGFGIVYAEAMALGVPVIGGGESGTTTPIKHSFTGILVDPCSVSIVEDVSHAVQRFMEDREYYNQTSKNASLFVREHLTWDKNAKKTLAALKQ